MRPPLAAVAHGLRRMGTVDQRQAKRCRVRAILHRQGLPELRDPAPVNLGQVRGQPGRGGALQPRCQSARKRPPLLECAP